jgi:TRAP-type uncharacterized transport system fused permease subunit
MFVIPFVFAIYPELLLIESAVLDPKSLPSAAQYLPGYDGQVHVAALLWLLVKLIVALYLLASALAGFDRKSLTAIEVALRLLVALLIMFKPAAIHLPALLAAVALLASHYLRNRQVAVA